MDLCDQGLRLRGILEDLGANHQIEFFVREGQLFSAGLDINGRRAQQINCYIMSNSTFEKRAVRLNSSAHIKHSEIMGVQEGNPLLEKLATSAQNQPTGISERGIQTISCRDLN